MKHVARLARFLHCTGRGQQGVTVVEVLVAGIVVVVGLIFIAQFFTSTASRVLASDTRSLMSQLATQEVETIRAMDYSDVGTVGGDPAGLLAAESTKTVTDPNSGGVRTFKIQRQVTYFTDPSYSGPYPANYRRATIIVSSVDNSTLKAITMSTNVAGGALGGTLDITVHNVAGVGVPNVPLVITDTVLSPNVLINASSIRTDSDGHLQVPGLTPDANYYVRADLTGYNSAATKTAQVVAKGTTTPVSFTMDRLATMVIHLTDPNGVALSGVSLTVTGVQLISPWTFSLQSLPTPTVTPRCRTSCTRLRCSPTGFN